MGPPRIEPEPMSDVQFAPVALRLLQPPGVGRGGDASHAMGWELHPHPMVACCSSSAGTESFGLFSCMVNGEEREQTHRAVFR